MCPFYSGTRIIRFNSFFFKSSKDAACYRQYTRDNGTSKSRVSSSQWTCCIIFKSMRLRQTFRTLDRSIAQFPSKTIYSDGIDSRYCEKISYGTIPVFQNGIWEVAIREENLHQLQTNVKTWNSPNKMHFQVAYAIKTVGN